jgi:hypothetical protein
MLVAQGNIGFSLTAAKGKNDIREKAEAAGNEIAASLRRWKKVEKVVNGPG